MYAANINITLTLDKVPWVSKVYKKHLKIRDYFLPANLYPMLMILTSRGCPFNCNFCNIPFKSSYRTRSVDDVISEIKYIKKEMPEVKEVFFDCDADTLLIKVNQIGGAACHEGYRSCFFRKVQLESGDAEIVGERVFDPAEVYRKK